MKRLVVGITGASGSIYAARFLEVAVRHFDKIYLTISESGEKVIESELGIKASGIFTEYKNRIEYYSPSDLFAPPSSGSVKHDGMVIIPCSMGTVGRIAAGVSDDLITRAADVALKERRPLVIVVRETPFGLTHLRNLASAAGAGAVVLPASPGFYHHPKSIGDLVDFVVARTLDQLGIDHGLLPEWDG
ncbi:MAG: UbiX family flavin prenyltransferase [Armatimonadota bacterium]